jgi:uncharacterized protein YcfJ
MKVNYLIPTLIAFSMATSVAMASGNHHRYTEYGTVLDVETIWSTKVTSQPVIEHTCSMVRQERNADVGKQIIGGLIGSGIGNAISDKDGAGTAGAVLGALFASREARPRYVERCSEQVVYKKSRTREPSHYRIRASVNGQIVTLNSDTPYRRHQTIPITVHSRYSTNSRYTR